MEYCSSGTLHDLLQSRRPPVLQEAELRGVLKSLAGALTYLHKRFIIHGDIKPSNVLLGEDCRIVSNVFYSARWFFNLFTHRNYPTLDWRFKLNRPFLLSTLSVDRLTMFRRMFMIVVYETEAQLVTQ